MPVYASDRVFSALGVGAPSAAISAFESAADFEFKSIASAINTTDKTNLKPVWNTTTGVLMIAQGAGAGSQWRSANGITVITPS